MGQGDTTGRWVRRELRDASEPSIPIDVLFDDDTHVSPAAIAAPEEAPRHVRPEEIAALADLEVRISDARTTEHRARLLEAVAEGYEAVGRRRAATDAWGRLAAIDPTHDQAFERSEAALSDDGSWEDLVELYLARVEVSRGRERIAVIRRAAAVLEEKVGDPAQALEALTLAWALDPTAKDTCAALERLAAATGAYAELVTAAEAELARSPARPVKNAILERCSAWYAALGRHDEARACLDAVLAEQPADPDALEARAHALEEGGRWEELVETLGLVARAQPTRREEADRYVTMGDVLRGRLGRPEDAAAAYLAAIATVPHHEVALARLDALYAEDLDPAEDGPDDIEPLTALSAHHERNGDHLAAVRAMRRLAAILPSHLDRVNMHVRIARKLEAKLDDPVGALDAWDRVLDLAPMHREANAAVRRIHGERGEWAAVVRAIEREAERTDGDVRRAVLYAEAARVYEERLSAPERAQAAWARAVEADPTQLDAALRLATVHCRHGRFEPAYELLAPLTSQLHRQPPAVKREVRRRLGEAAFAIGRDDEAMAMLSAAAEGDGPPRILLGLTVACFRAERFDEVVKWGRRLLSDHAEDDLILSKWRDIHYMLGVAHLERGDVGGAARAFREVLARDPGHRPTLEKLLALEEGRERWEAAAELRKALAEVADTPEERVRRLEELGDVCAERLSQLPRAVHVYEEAATERPDDHRILHKLLAAYQKSARWPDALAVIAQIQAQETRPEVRVRYAYTAGVILRDELGDVDHALEWFHAALSIDPTFLKAFAAIDAMLTKAQAWGQLERSYRRALKSVIGTGNPDLEFQLWHNLGLVYRDRLRDHARAVEAFRMASRLQPDNREEHRILGELFTSVGRGAEETVADHQAILDRDPECVGSYHALFELYARAGDHERARAAAAALAFMGEADATEREWVERSDPPVLSASRTLRPEQWERIDHADLVPEVGVVFEALAGPLRSLRARPDAEIGLDPDELVESGATRVRLAALFKGLSRYLRLPVHPRLFVSRERRGGLGHVGDAVPPASLCGATPLGGFTTAQIEFLVAHHLTFYRADLSILTVLRTTNELVAAMRTAMAITGYAPEDAASDDVRRIAAAVDRRWVPALRQACARLAGRDLERAVLRWTAAAELTAARTGFVVCHELPAASLILQDLPAPASGLGVSQVLRDLVRFSVSEPYFEVLEALASRVDSG